jgi:hypothetical protein
LRLLSKQKDTFICFVQECSGAPGSVGTTPIHPELGGEKAEGITELDGQLSGIVILVPGTPFTYWLNSVVRDFTFIIKEIIIKALFTHSLYAT